jgi:hypothetical protein
VDITRLRLRNQRLSGARFTQPAKVVAWLGAVQAQEYADSKWALALRTRRTNHWTTAGLHPFSAPILVNGKVVGG